MKQDLNFIHIERYGLPDLAQTDAVSESEAMSEAKTVSKTDAVSKTNAVSKTDTVSQTDRSGSDGDFRHEGGGDGERSCLEVSREDS